MPVMTSAIIGTVHMPPEMWVCTDVRGTPFPDIGIAVLYYLMGLRDRSAPCIFTVM